MAALEAALQEALIVMGDFNYRATPTST